MKMYQTNGDKILQAIIEDEELMQLGEFDPNKYQSLPQALGSNNTIIQAIARIIERKEQKVSENEIYKEIFNFLKEKNI